MYFTLTCPNCGGKHKVDDTMFYLDEESENYRWDCYRQMEDLIAINLVTNILDSLNDEQREILGTLLGKITSFPSQESLLFCRIIKEHFKGSEGIETWGLW